MAVILERKKKWTQGRLGEHTSKIGSGLTPTGGEAAYQKTGIPLIRSQNVQMNSFDRTGLAFISPQQDEEMKNTRVQSGDVLLNITGASIGRVCVVPEELCPANVNQHVCIIRSNGSFDPHFLAFYISSPVFQAFIERNQSGATRQALTKDMIENFEIPMPKIEDQRRIVSLLKRAISLQHVQFYKQKLFEDFLPAQFEKLFGRHLVETNKTLEEVLEKPLSNGLFEKNDKYGHEGVPVIWVDNLYHTMTIETDNLRRVQIDKATTEKYRVNTNDLLFTRSSLVREGIGQINIVENLTESTTYECHIIRARVKCSIVNPYYVLGLYRSAFGRREILKRANTATMTTISQEALEQLPCPVPPMKMQEKFAGLARQTESLVLKYRERERQLQVLFDSLLHQAFEA